MNITLPIFLVGAVTGSAVMVADAPPKFNVASGCKEAVALDQSMDTDPGISQNYQSCMNDEESAHEQLVQSWSRYSAADKTRCVGQTEVGGMPSYVEVLEACWSPSTSVTRFRRWKMPSPRTSSSRWPE
jgi:hypothetical protein